MYPFPLHISVCVHRSPRQGAKRRQKLLEQISAGLTENHYKEMEHLSAGAVDLMAHLLQPNPAKRARLFETMGHPWITRDGIQPLEPYKQPAIDHSLQTAVSSFSHEVHIYITFCTATSLYSMYTSNAQYTRLYIRISGIV